MDCKGTGAALSGREAVIEIDNIKLYQRGKSDNDKYQSVQVGAYQQVAKWIKGKLKIIRPF